MISSLTSSTYIFSRKVRNCSFSVPAVFAIFAFFTADISADNPLVRHIFTADPAPIVYKDTFYIFCGHDEGVKNTSGWILNGWHVLSSADMVNWTDHGDVLSVKDVTWLNAKQAWAAQCVYRNGKFYFYICDSGEIGVAVSDNILGPYKDELGKPLISNATSGACPGDDNIDPSVFIDDDGQAYIYWGTDGVARQAKLKSSMTEIDGTITVPQGVSKFFEASWVHKKDKTYYYSYAAYNSSGKSWPSNIDYATSDSPLGPWTYKGTLNDYAGTGTNHSGIIQFRDKWYFVYATDYLSDGTPWQRSVQIDFLYYNSDGTMKKIVQTQTGVTPVGDASFKENVFYKLKVKHSGKFAGVVSDAETIDAKLEQQSESDSYAQQWKFISTGNGLYEVVNRKSGLALDASLSDNRIVQYTYKDTDNQKWKITRTSDNYFLFVNKANNRVLEIINADKTDGAAVQHWEYNRETCQLWELLVADSNATTVTSHNNKACVYPATKILTNTIWSSQNRSSKSTEGTLFNISGRLMKNGLLKSNANGLQIYIPDRNHQ